VGTFAAGAFIIADTSWLGLFLLAAKNGNRIVVECPAQNRQDPRRPDSVSSGEPPSIHFSLNRNWNRMQSWS
jgi:hypothetical protein